MVGVWREEREGGGYGPTYLNTALATGNVVEMVDVVVIFDNDSALFKGTTRGPDSQQVPISARE